MRMRLELRQMQTLIEKMGVEFLPPEYKTAELRENLDLMWRLSNYDLVDLGANHKILANMFLESPIKWNDKKGCYYLSDSALLNHFNYNRMQYIAIGPGNNKVTAKMDTAFDRSSLEDLIENNVKIIRKKKMTVVCAQDDTAILELRGPFVKLIAKPETEHYDLALDTAVELITKIHSENMQLAIPSISMNQYLLGFFLAIPEYSATRDHIKNVLTSFDLFLNKGLESVVLLEQNISADQFYHPAKKQGCHVVDRDWTPRHIKYFYSDEDNNLIVGFDAELDKAVIKKRLENPIQVSIDKGGWTNKEELEYDLVTKLSVAGRAKERTLPGTRLLRNTKHASFDLEYDANNSIIKERSTGKDLVYLNKTTATIASGLDSMEKDVAYEVVNAIYDQLLLMTPLADVGKKKTVLRKDEREVVKEVNARAKKYITRVKGVGKEYGLLLAQRELLQEAIEKQNT